jgi:hypothetical protein
MTGADDRGLAVNVAAHQRVDQLWLQVYQGSDACPTGYPECDGIE